jgi:hypothetical protein
MYFKYFMLFFSFISIFFLISIDSQCLYIEDRQNNKRFTTTIKILKSEPVDWKKNNIQPFPPSNSGEINKYGELYRVEVCNLLISIKNKNVYWILIIQMSLAINIIIPVVQNRLPFEEQNVFMPISCSFSL